MNKYITVLDFEVGRIFQYEINEEPHRNEDGVIDHEEFLTNYGHNMKYCKWMVHDDNRVIVQTPHGEIKQLQRDYDMVKSIEKNK